MKIRALVIDDSVVVRRTVANVLAAADDIEVVGTASDGQLGLRRIADLHPDVVTLDVEMPGMNGLETLAEIRKSWPNLPVIMYSTLTESGASATLDALALGAADYATKPSGARDREEVAAQVRGDLLPLVRMWGRRRVPAGPPRAAAAARAARPTAPALLPVPDGRKPIRLVAIGVSTGGPDALAAMLPSIPADLSVPVIIVQHMPPVFTAMLAQRLNGLSGLTVSEAVDGEAAKPGHAYIAPGGRHLEVRRSAAGFTMALTDGPQENSCRPAVDVMFRTASAASSGGVLAVVLTGMGQDGLNGAKVIREAGGPVLVQDEASSVVWGMPGFVARAGLAYAQLPIGEIGAAITRAVNRTVMTGAAS
jgi:two-component system chemotaxis response regulator CheB